MSNENTPVLRRLVLVLALLAVIGVTVAGPQVPTASAAACTRSRVNFYSDDTYTTLVGYCIAPCCQIFTCYGQSTLYEKLVYQFSCN